MIIKLINCQLINWLSSSCTRPFFFFFDMQGLKSLVQPVGPGSVTVHSLQAFSLKLFAHWQILIQPHADGHQLGEPDGLTCIVAGGSLSWRVCQSLCLCFCLCLGFSLQVWLQLDRRAGPVLRQRRGSHALHLLRAQRGASGQDQRAGQEAQQHPEVAACALSGGSHF